MSLLLLPRFVIMGGGGARPVGLPRFGMAGGMPTGAPADPFDSFPIAGAERSLVAAFFSLAPLVMSVSNAP